MTSAFAVREGPPPASMEGSPPSVPTPISDATYAAMIAAFLADASISAEHYLTVLTSLGIEVFPADRVVAESGARISITAFMIAIERRLLGHLRRGGDWALQHNARPAENCLGDVFDEIRYDMVGDSLRYGHEIRLRNWALASPDRLCRGAGRLDRQPRSRQGPDTVHLIDRNVRPRTEPEPSPSESESETNTRDVDVATQPN